MPRLLVYGTLKQGQISEAILGNQKFISKAVIVDKLFKLYEMRANFVFPCLVEAEDGYPVYGELYEVSENCLEHLDRYEGVNQGLYCRTTVKVRTAPGEIVEDVTVYQFLKSYSGLTHIGQCWPARHLLHFQFADKCVFPVKGKKTIEGVALYRTEDGLMVEGPFHDNDELVKTLRPHLSKYGGRDHAKPWNTEKYEVKKCPLEVDVMEYVLQSCTNGTSPAFANLDDLIEWSVENTTAFDGKKLSKAEWAEMIHYHRPVVDEET